MARTVMFFFGAACVFMLMGAPASAVEFGVDLPVYSKYMWRGLELNEDPVLQPDVWIKYKNLTATFWGNCELTGVHNGPHENGSRGNFTEFDYILKYADTFKDFAYSAGYIHYTYPKTDFRSTQEVFASLGYISLLTPTLTVYRDIQLVDGWYGTLGINYDIPLPQFLNSTIATSAAIGYSSKKHSEAYYGLRKNAFSDALITVGLKTPVTKNISIMPSINYTGLLDHSFRDKNLNKKDNTIWFGLMLSYSFSTD